LSGTYNKDEDIRKKVAEFSADKEVQAMLLEEKMAILDMQMTKEEGRQEERIEIQDVYGWLFENGRDEDVKKATKDGAF